MRRGAELVDLINLSASCLRWFAIALLVTSAASAIATATR